MKKSLKKDCVELYNLNEEISALTNRAEKIKKKLRLELTEPVEVAVGVFCRVCSSMTPVFDNKKLYAKMTGDEIIVCTKPLVGELKKRFPDYEEFVEGAITEWIETRCIKFGK